MNEEEARRIRDEIDSDPEFDFYGYGFNGEYEITVKVAREGGSARELPTPEAWERFRGYVRLERGWQAEQEALFEEAKRKAD